MAYPVVLALIVSVGLIVALVLTQEPQGAAVAAFIAAPTGCPAQEDERRDRSRGHGERARTSRARALRRGIGLGAIVGLILALQSIGGLTPLTALFVVLSFAIAEYVLTAGATPSR